MFSVGVITYRHEFLHIKHNTRTGTPSATFCDYTNCVYVEHTVYTSSPQRAPTQRGIYSLWKQAHPARRVQTNIAGLMHSLSQETLSLCFLVYRALIKKPCGLSQPRAWVLTRGTEGNRGGRAPSVLGSTGCSSPLRRRDAERAAVVLNTVHQNTWLLPLKHSRYIRATTGVSLTEDSTTPFSTTNFQFLVQLRTQPTIPLLNEHSLTHYHTCVHAQATQRRI